MIQAESHLSSTHDSVLKSGALHPPLLSQVFGDSSGVHTQVNGSFTSQVGLNWKSLIYDQNNYAFYFQANKFSLEAEAICVRTWISPSFLCQGC